MLHYEIWIIPSIPPRYLGFYTTRRYGFIPASQSNPGIVGYIQLGDMNPSRHPHPTQVQQVLYNQEIRFHPFIPIQPRYSRFYTFRRYESIPASPSYPSKFSGFQEIWFHPSIPILPTTQVYAVGEPMNIFRKRTVN